MFSVKEYIHNGNKVRIHGQADQKKIEEAAVKFLKAVVKKRRAKREGQKS